MRNFLKVGEFDPTLTLVALAQQPELWNTETLRTRYPQSPHHACDDILLFFNEITDNVAAIANDIQVKPYPAWEKLPSVRPIVFDLMRRVEGVQLGRLMITRLPPGKTIPAHADEGAPAIYYERYQLPLQSLPGCVFRAGDEALQMRGGEVWWFDNQKVHSVENYSADDRISLIAGYSEGLMLSAAVENLTERLEELKTFFSGHYEELSLHKGRFPLNPNYAAYLEKDARGEVLFVALRNDGVMCGYFVGFVFRGLHYQDCLTLQLDIFNTVARNGSPKGAIMLFREVEREARRRGVNLVVQGSKLHKDASILFQRLGYEPIETFYAKWLD